MKYIGIFISFFLYFSCLGQSIRKDYREFTSQEMTDYRAALQSLRNAGTWNTLSTAHANHFSTQIHTTGSFTGEQFLPWHRFFLLEVEWFLRNTSSTAAYLSIPYWDWRTDNATTANWHSSFLSNSNLTGFTFTRCLPGSSCAATGSFPYLANSSDITNTLNLTPFWNNTTTKTTTSVDFSHRLEHYHDRVHVWVGGNTGTMNTGSSPNDPIFYLHHNMIDKLWQEWEDKTTGLQSSFPNGTSGMVHYTAPEYPFSVTMNPLKDSRSETNPVNNTSYSRTNDVWFAFNKKVILDGANGSDFVCNDASSPYTYRYTAATSTEGTTVEGSTFVGDLQRDASDNVISDAKGGFRVESGVTANFKAGKDITYSPGFWAKSGSNVSARIISTANGNIINDIVETREAIAHELKFNYVVYPNPTSSKITIDGILPNENNSVEFNIFDLSGRKVESSKDEFGFGVFSKTIDLEHLQNGIYILHINENGNVHSKKLLKSI